MCPCPTLPVQPYDCPHMVGARLVRYSFLLYDSFIHYSTPVYPDAIQVNNLPHKCFRINAGAVGFWEV